MIFLRFGTKVCFILIAIILILSACNRNQEVADNSLTIFCGSANKPAMEEIAAKFEKENNIRVNMIFGGSGTLLSQLELSQKGEIYLPGSPDYIIKGERKKLLIEGSDRIVAYLVPAIITPAGNPAGIHSLADLTRPEVKVALGNPETVCLGLYAIEILEENNLLEAIMKNIVTFGGSCLKTANLAAMKQVDAILGWRVFHYWNPNQMEFVPIAPENIPRISYIPISIPVYSRDVNLSQTFIEYVLSSQGRSIYEKFGYLTSAEQAKQFAPQAKIGGEYRLPAKYFELVKNLGK